MASPRANTLKINYSLRISNLVSSSPEVVVASEEDAEAGVAEVEATQAANLNNVASFPSQVVAKTRNAHMNTLQATCPVPAK